MKSVALRDGLRVAYQEWGSANIGNSAKKILAIHGWLDNSNSFYLLGPHLASLGYHFVAIDQIGHGKSSHISLDSSYQFISGVAQVNEVVEKLGWEQPNILGHSLGAGIGMMFAGCFPEKVHKLILIDGMLAPLTPPADSAAKNLRRAIESDDRYAVKVAKSISEGNAASKIYPSFADAVNARLGSVATYPGSQSLSLEAARKLVGRFVGWCTCNFDTIIFFCFYWYSIC